MLRSGQFTETVMFSTDIVTKGMIDGDVDNMVVMRCREKK